MKFRDCLTFGKDLGLDTVGEAYLNIRNHAIQIFEYSKLTDEMNEITSEYNKLYDEGLLNCDSLIDDIIDLCS